MTGETVAGIADGEGRLIAADPRLLALQESAGGMLGEAIAVPQIAALSRLAHRLNILISRGVIAAEGPRDLDLWVRAQPGDGVVRLAIGGWRERQPRSEPAHGDARALDFLRAASDWIWECDAALILTGIAAAPGQAIDMVPGGLIGKPLTRLFRLIEDAAGDLPLLVALAGRSRLVAQRARLKIAGEPLVTIAGVPVRSGDGGFAGFRGSVTALSEEEAAAAMAAVPATPPSESDFAQRLNTALRTPLARIVANAETIGEQATGPLRGDYAGYASDIASAARHLMALVDDLADLQAIEQPGFSAIDEAIDLAALARRAAGLLAMRAAERGVRIDPPDEAERLPARGEQRRVLQILVNLIGNAVRHSPEGGMVWLRTEREGDLAVIVVADQGKGIAAADHERIFEKFARIDPVDADGSGLGLYIARRLARAMGGDIAVDSAPGQGARFTLTLPVAG